MASRERLVVLVTRQGGILSIDSVPGNENILATAGADSVVVVFDREAARIKASLTGHSKKVNGKFNPLVAHLQGVTRKL